ncbi:MAG: hypothetical protein M1820_006011 [Bogoriella megaspora]|nr:MAG: hypothetical protein M1820_006011 [Bogoriella megaspora]
MNIQATIGPPSPGSSRQSTPTVDGSDVRPSERTTRRNRHELLVRAYEDSLLDLLRPHACSTSPLEEVQRWMRIVLEGQGTASTTPCRQVLLPGKSPRCDACIFNKAILWDQRIMENPRAPGSFKAWTRIYGELKEPERMFRVLQKILEVNSMLRDLRRHEEVEDQYIESWHLMETWFENWRRSARL